MIKDANETVLTSEENMLRKQEYFSELMNEENERKGWIMWRHEPNTMD